MHESLFLYRYKNGFMYVRSKHSDILCLFLYYKTINIVLNLDGLRIQYSKLPELT